MSILEGEIDSNWRYNSRTGVFQPVSITAEEQLVQEFSEFPGNYGFTLNEVPDISSLSITEVKRVSDSQIFTHTTNSSVGNTEYFFDYSNDVPILFFNSINDGETFLIKYSGLGAAVNAKNLLSIASRAGNFETRLQSLIRTNPFNKTLTNQNVWLYNSWAVVNNLTIIGNCEIRPNTPDAIGIIEILGDLNLSNVSVLKTYRCIFIVHGSIKVLTGTATISGQDGFAGGDGTILSSPPLTAFNGGGGGGTGQIGGNGSSVSVAGGQGGYCLADHSTQTNAAGAAFPSNAGAGALGGGGGGGAPVNLSSQLLPGAGGYCGGGGGGGAWLDSTVPAYTEYAGAAGGAKTVFHGAGGHGGDGSYSAGLGGAGGGSGGTALIFFVLGTISPDFTFYAGRGGAYGAGGSAGATYGQTGDITVYSKYTGTPPGTYDSALAGNGLAGTQNFYKLGSASDMSIFEINRILHSELAVYHSSLSWRIADKFSVSI